MRDRLVINVTELLQHPGTQRKLSFDEAVEDLAVELARVEPTEPLHYELALEAVDGESVHVRGKVSGEYVATCRRCLTETRVPFTVEMSDVYRPESDVWEEGYVVEGQTVDLHGMVRDNVMLAMPEFPLCRADCLGLCSSCGANLNQRPCTCTSDVTSDRWSALKALLED